MRASIRYTGVLVLVSALFGVGCDRTFGRTSETFRLASDEAMTRMVANPEAPVQNTEPILGVAAQTASGIADNYHKARTLEKQTENRDRPAIIKVGD